jgi:hypothetical protein
MNAQPQRWAKITYTGKETRHITKLFKKLDIQITFTHTHTHTKQQQQQQQQQNIYYRTATKIKHTTHTAKVEYTS